MGIRKRGRERMRGNNNRNSRRRELLVEYYGQGSLQNITSAVKTGLSQYGKVLTNAFGVVLGDSIYLAKLTFSPLKSNDTYNKWARNNKERRNSRLSALKTSVDALQENSLEAALLLGPIAPHIMLTDKVLRVACFDDDNVTNFLENSGLIELPGLRALQDMFDNGLDTEFEDGDIEKLHKAITGLSDEDDENGFIGKAWNITQRIFLLDVSESTLPTGPLILEGEEPEGEPKPKAKAKENWKEILRSKEIPDDVETIEDYQAWAYGQVMEPNVPDASEYLEERAKDQQMIIDNTRGLLEAYCELAVCTNNDELFQALESLNERVEKKVDLQKIREDVDNAVEEAMKNEKVQKEWKEKDKNAEKLEGDEAKQAFEKYVRDGVILTAKGKIIPTIRPLFEDTQDLLKDKIFEGLDPKLIGRLQKYTELQPLAEQMIDGMNQIKQIIEPLLKKAESNG
jgi:hypothetical protein